VSPKATISNLDNAGAVAVGDTNRSSYDRCVAGSSSRKVVGLLLRHFALSGSGDCAAAPSPSHMAGALFRNYGSEEASGKGANSTIHLAGCRKWAAGSSSVEVV